MSSFSASPYSCPFTSLHFFFNPSAPPETITLSLHDALPISFLIARHYAGGSGCKHLSNSRHRRCWSAGDRRERGDRKSTRLNSSHRCISYAVFCLKKKKNEKGEIAVEMLDLVRLMIR